MPSRFRQLPGIGFRCAGRTGTDDGREVDHPKAARKARGMPIGRPRKLSPDKLALAERMRAGGEPVPVIAQTLRVSTPTMYRLLAERSKATTA